MKLKLTLLAAVLCILPGLALAQILEGKVTKVTDGDTFTMRIGKRSIVVRLYGIDCPEYDQPYGKAATAYTKKMCEGKIVTLLITDVERNHNKELDTDKRLIGEVTLPNGKILNHLLVEKGHAWWYSKYASDDTKLASLEKKARKKKAGLWKSKNPVPPWEHRHAKK